MEQTNSSNQADHSDSSNSCSSITLKKVSSSHIMAVGYDEATETLDVQFKNGSLYRHTKVTKDTYRRFRESASLGSFYSRYISGYPYTKLT